MSVSFPHKMLFVSQIYPT